MRFQSNIQSNFQSICQRGQVIVLFAIILPLIISFAALVVNIGNLYMHHNRLQNVADATVLTYASNYVQTEDQINSEVLARNIAKMNLGNLNYDVQFSTNDNIASVQLSTNMDVYFIPINSTTVTVVSSAQMRDSSGNSSIKLIQ